jgi:hypothetical protein
MTVRNVPAVSSHARAPAAFAAAKLAFIGSGGAPEGAVVGAVDATEDETVGRDVDETVGRAVDGAADGAVGGAADRVVASVGHGRLAALAGRPGNRLVRLGRCGACEAAGRDGACEAARVRRRV